MPASELTLDRAELGGNNPPLSESLPIEFAELSDEVEAIAGRANLAPKSIADDATLGTVGLIVKDARDLSKRLDKTREDRKAPFLRAGRDVDAFFKGFALRLDRIVGSLARIQTEYLREKELAERRRRDEEARLERERAQRELAEAERLEAENRTKEANRALDNATVAESEAAKLQRQAEARPAELARTRNAGVTTTLVTEWVFEISDYEAIPLGKLRPYLTRADVEKAIRAAVKAGRRSDFFGGDEIVKVFEESRASNR